MPAALVAVVQQRLVRLTRFSRSATAGGELRCDGWSGGRVRATERGRALSLTFASWNHGGRCHGEKERLGWLAGRPGRVPSASTRGEATFATRHVYH
jgi:hypothetical protein